MSDCLMESCNRVKWRYGYCQPHFNRLQEFGSPDSGKPIVRRVANGVRLKELQEFLSIPLIEHGNECSGQALGTDNGKGYRVIWLDGKVRLVHRVVYEHYYGAFDEANPVVRHLCGNGHLGCNQPNHLKAGTQKENGVDAAAQNRMPRGTDNAQAVLTEVEVLAIRQMCSSGTASQRVIGEKFGVHQVTVSKIHLRKLWHWL